MSDKKLNIEVLQDKDLPGIFHVTNLDTGNKSIEIISRKIYCSLYITRLRLLKYYMQLGFTVNVTWLTPIKDIQEYRDNNVLKHNWKSHSREGLN